MNELPASSRLLGERDSAEQSYLRLLEHDGADMPEAAAAASMHPIAVECAGVGAALGATLGVVAATLVATGSITLLGLGLAGPLAAALFGGLVGLVGGGALGIVLDQRRLMALDAEAMVRYRQGHGITNARGCVPAP
jgi:hypothetical protein